METADDNPALYRYYEENLTFAAAFRYLCSALGAEKVTDDEAAEAADLMAQACESTADGYCEADDYGIVIEREGIEGTADERFTVKIL